MAQISLEKRPKAVNVQRLMRIELFLAKQNIGDKLSTITKYKPDIRLIISVYPL
ncbi:protein of unknown function [Xenorhabdus poinarii G6]|uniref:Uncharacterized protein n=1 Tax=Xenorhabdus poinarii G6 TaxID=1354304 RepID=A0A068R7M2_9GAMM|nr:protein of unknown function [Xenorhabdus poinarii G6]